MILRDRPSRVRFEFIVFEQLIELRVAAIEHVPCAPRAQAY